MIEHKSVLFYSFNMQHKDELSQSDKLSCVEKMHQHSGQNRMHRLKVTLWSQAGRAGHFASFSV